MPETHAILIISGKFCLAFSLLVLEMAGDVCLLHRKVSVMEKVISDSTWNKLVQSSRISSVIKLVPQINQMPLLTPQSPSFVKCLR